MLGYEGLCCMMVLTAIFLQVSSPGHCCGGALSIYCPLSHGLAGASKPFLFCLQAALLGLLKQSCTSCFDSLCRQGFQHHQIDCLQSHTA